MSATAPARPANCWRLIGVWGDKTCPELATHIHCSNCPVLGAGGRSLFEQEPPPGHREEWTAVIAATKARDVEHRSVLLFRVAEEWLALDTKFCVEIGASREVHAVAHRSRELLAGMVNVRGQLLLCISMRSFLLGGRDAASQAPARLLVARRGADTWAFGVDAVHGVERVPVAGIGPVPANVAGGLEPYAIGVMPWRDAHAGLLDGDRIFDTLRRRIG